MSPVLKPLDQQVIVITGASSGIGRATVELAAQRGAAVVLAARSLEAIETYAAAITARGGQAVAVQADVGVRADVERVAEVAIETFGRIDTWVNNAGVSIYGRLDEVNEEDSRKLFDTNFWGVVNGSLVALPHLKAEGGALINVGSEVSDTVVPLQGMYSASKHAVKGFTDSLRVEIENVDEAPVSITLIQPTAVDTPYPQHARNYMDREPKLPDPKIDPTQVANAILEAAENPTRAVAVGTMATLNTVLSRILPSVADRLAAGQVDKQQLHEAPRASEGALFKASGGGETHGSTPASA